MPSEFSIISPPFPILPIVASLIRAAPVCTQLRARDRVSASTPASRSTDFPHRAWLYRRQGTHGKRCTNTLRDTNTDNLHDARQNARTHLKEVASDAIDCVINGQHMDALAVLDVGAREHLHDITKAHAQILAHNLPCGIDSQP
jgi:hypothetical protein